MEKSVLIGDFLHRIRRPIDLEPASRYKLLTVKLYHKGVILREEKLGADIKSKMYQVREGDFILSGIDARNGAFGIVPPELDGAVVTNDFWYFEIDEKVVDKSFFLELTATHWFDEICRMGSDGTTQRIRLQKNKFFNQKINLPDLIKQRTFNKRFQAIKTSDKALTSELTHQQTLLKKLHQQILQEAIEGKLTADWRAQNRDVEPASELLKRIAAEKEQLIKDKKIKAQKPLPPITDEEKPFELPQGWEWCRLQELANLITDGKHGDCQSMSDSGYYFLSAKDIQKGRLLYNNARQIVPQEFMEVHKRTNLETGDICIVNTGATVGKLAIAPDSPLTQRTTFQKSVAVIKVVRSFISEQFIALFLACDTPKLLATSWGSAINNLLLGDLKKKPIALPSLPEQQAIVTKVEKLLVLCDQLEAQIAQNQTHAEQLMQAVLKEAFSHNSKAEPASVIREVSIDLPDAVICGD